MQISIIIVSWNTRDLLKKCLQTIYEHARGISFEIFVIDNGSRDGTVEMIQNEFKEVRCMVNTVNMGFAAANNQGILSASGRYILLLNPDTELIDNALQKMIDFMENKSSCGIAGCHLLNPDKGHQDSVRRFPGFLDQTFILLKLHHIFPHFKPFDDYREKGFDYSKARIVDQVMGAFFMVRREVFEKIGLLDEKSFFNWFEEVDFCKRAYEAGFEVWYTPHAEIIHHYGQSFKQIMPIAKQKMWNKSLSMYFRKHHPKSAYCSIIFLGLASFAIVSFITEIKKLHTHQKVNGENIKNVMKNKLSKIWKFVFVLVMVWGVFHYTS
jgi:GT2 family glycosyltransferase